LTLFVKTIFANSAITESSTFETPLLAVLLAKTPFLDPEVGE
jgi:hypothetical protein